MKKRRDIENSHLVPPTQHDAALAGNTRVPDQHTTTRHSSAFADNYRLSPRLHFMYSLLWIHLHFFFRCHRAAQANNCPLGYPPNHRYYRQHLHYWYIYRTSPGIASIRCEEIKQMPPANKNCMLSLRFDHQVTISAAAKILRNTCPRHAVL